MTTPHLEILRAQNLLQASRPAEALRELATLPPEAASDPFAFLLRSIALNELERWDEAAAAARAGLAGGPDSDLLGQLGRALHHLGDLPAAERVLLDALALDPDDTGLLCHYAELCIEARQTDKAARLIDLAAAQDPEAELVLITRSRLAYARGDDREAQRIARECVGMYPNSPNAHALLGSMNATRGQVRPAHDQYRQAVAGAPADRDFAKAAMELRIATHPLLVPIRPFVRFGPIKTWIAAIIVIYGLRMLGLPVLSLIAAMSWIALCVYSWVVPPLVRRWYLRRWNNGRV